MAKGLAFWVSGKQNSGLENSVRGIEGVYHAFAQISSIYRKGPRNSYQR